MLNWAVPWNGDVAHLIEQPYDTVAPALCSAAPPPAPSVMGVPQQWWLPNGRSRVACVFCKLEAERRHLLLPAWTFSSSDPVTAPSSPDQLRPARSSSPAVDPDAERVCDGDPAPLLVCLRLPAPAGSGTTTEVVLGPRDFVRSPFDRQPQPDETVAIVHWAAGSFSTYWEGPLARLTWRYRDVTHGEHVWSYLSGWDGPIRCSQCGLGRLAARGDRVPCPLCHSRHPVGQPVGQHGRWRGSPYQGAPFHWPSDRVVVLRLGQTGWRDAVRCRTNETHEFTTPPTYDPEIYRYLRECSRCGIILTLAAEAASWNPEPLPNIRLIPCPACGEIHTLAEGHRALENRPTLTPEQIGDIILTPEQLRELSNASGWVRDSEATATRIQAEQHRRRAFVEALVEQWCQEISNPGVCASLREQIPAIVQFMVDNPTRSSGQRLRDYFVPSQYRQEQQNFPSASSSVPQPTTPLCACGCGQHVKKAQSKFCAGHNTAGYHAQRRRERVS